MKKIKIYSVLSNSDNETTTVEALADYDKKEKIIKYVEEDLKVEIQIQNNRILMNRKNDEYDLNLIFELNEKIKCKYQVNSIGLTLDIVVYTKKLEIEDNRIYINYEMYNDNKIIGIFEYKLLLME
ncbi:MAG: DUF1934 family protein [Bacilli bacterium]|nr:DUF1934 family protein [Bacilli bacterium]